MSRKFVTNIDPITILMASATGEKMRYLTIGAPQATENLTVDELERRGVAGLYDETEEVGGVDL